ncbi:hypothetical protein BN844_5082 [Pseudomonas sp. SHC52]|nr:hypothetical protein BN844_5082 [Pseudomonas sp. SHC52]
MLFSSVNRWWAFYRGWPQCLEKPDRPIHCGSRRGPRRTLRRSIKETSHRTKRSRPPTV